MTKESCKIDKDVYNELQELKAKLNLTSSKKMYLSDVIRHVLKKFKHKS